MNDKEYFKKLGFEIIEIDPGEHVNCDTCNGDYTNSEEKGGFLFGSNAICPKCAPRFEEDARKYGETRYIRARARPEESFRDFVYRIRK